jgi:glycosyltransferase involved in cell wall biosynthesis
MKILHLDNTAGVPCMICSGLRHLGIQADVLLISPDKVGYVHDLENLKGVSFWDKILCGWRTIGIAKKYDVVHTHGGLTRNRWDIWYIKKVLRKPVVVHYHGSDVRKNYGLYHMGCVDKKIVSTPDLLKWLPDAEYIPNPMMLGGYCWDEDKQLRVIHVPSNRIVKGTKNIIKAVGIAQSFVNFDFKIVENQSHETVLREIKKAHVVIDWFNPVFGINGVVSLEAMSMGKIPVCYINPLYRELGCPIVSSVKPSVDSLVDCLVSLLTDREGMKQVSLNCFEYIKKMRNPSMLALRYYQIYNDLLGTSKCNLGQPVNSFYDDGGVI